MFWEKAIVYQFHCNFVPVILLIINEDQYK